MNVTEPSDPSRTTATTPGADAAAEAAAEPARGHGGFGFEVVQGGGPGGVGSGFGGAQVGKQGTGVGREGFVFRQRFKPEDARQSSGLDLTEHGESNDR